MNEFKQVNKDLKIVNFDSEYEITFSLVNEKPETLNSNWNIDQCVESITLIKKYEFKQFYIVHKILFIFRIFQENNQPTISLYKFLN
jgi:hypothetical protein